jgi:hypothetical protein
VERGDEMSDTYNARQLSDIEETALGMVRETPGLTTKEIHGRFHIPALAYLAILYLTQIQLVYIDVNSEKVYPEDL